jgi:hypothetical protein
MGRLLTDAEFDQEIAGLVDEARDELVERWRAAYRDAPPKGISKSLLVRAVAYEMQARRYGRLSGRLGQRLRRIAGAGATSGAAVSDKPDRTTSLRPGARLVREWNGRAHTVDVTENGYQWDGKDYRSLSAVARAITGARWSGPRFFGVSQG